MKPGCDILINKSKENMSVAAELVERRRFNAAANRLYYSLFQVAKAYAVSKNKMQMDAQVEVHRVARSVVHELVKDEGRFEDVFDDALALRKKSDYTPTDVTANELDLNFRNKASDLRSHLERLAMSA